MGIDIQWPLVLFTLVSGVGGGLLVPAGVAQLADKANAKLHFQVAVASMILLAVGGCFSLLHLASPQNVMAAVFNLFSFSGISIELILLGVCFIVAAVMAVLIKREAPAMALKVVGGIGIAVAILLLFFCGHGYVMVSRPGWDTDFLPFAYMGSALAGGAFAYGILLERNAPEEAQLKLYELVLLVCSIICAISCLAYSIVIAATASGSGPLLLLWAIGMVVCGIILVPSIAIYLYRQGKTDDLKRIVIIGTVVSVLAIIAVRAAMWDTSEGFLELFSLARLGAPVIP